MSLRFVKVPQQFSNDLPKDRPYTRLEAAYSIALDNFRGEPGTLRGYARLWQWSTGKVTRFLEEIGPDMRTNAVNKSQQNNETKTKQKRDSGGTLKERENRELQQGTEQRRDEGETETERTIIEKKRIDTFDQFWTAYPRKTGKAPALKIWQRLAPSADTTTAILVALDWQRQQLDWQKDGGRFIPHPSTWLNGRRWEDEQPAIATPVRSTGGQGGTLEELRAKGIDV